MVKEYFNTRTKGFSLVELMVALLFTMILMAGLASVFKSSLTAFHSSGELLSSARRNRMSVDMLSDDVNSAMMYLTDFSTPPQGLVAATNPPFFILPNMPILGAGASDPRATDELYFMMDQALPFEGRLAAPPVGLTANELANAGGAPSATDRTFTIECKTSGYAKQVQKGQLLGFKDDWTPGRIVSEPVVSGTQVTVEIGEDPMSSMTGAEGSKVAQNFKHLLGSGIVFLKKNQMVRYRIEMLHLDPMNANGIPCLVRDQGTYSPTGFVVDADQAQQIITENVSGFKVYLSANGGLAWAGLGLGATGFTEGWDQGIRVQLDGQLSAAGRPGYQTTRGDEFWFRSTPTLLRFDVTTRTATQREEYSNTPNVVAYKNLTQSLVFVPRHSGLIMN